MVRFERPSSQQASSLLSSSHRPTTAEEWRALLATLPPAPEPSAVLTDSFGRQHSYLRLSLTERCNLRCTYCMPEEGVPLQPASHLLTTEEILQLARHFALRGVRKYRLTGGEPTLRGDIVDIVRGLAQLEPDQIGMTTNGIVLEKYLDQLVEAGLNSINISLDTMHPDKFARLTRRPAAYLDRVWSSLAAAHEYESVRVKVNCVVMRGSNNDEVNDFLQLAEQFPRLQVRFIEYMPFDANGWNTDKFIGYQELLQQAPQLIPVASKDPHDTTKWYHLPSAPPTSRPQIGFITSMSNHFCAGCNRLRLTTDGDIKVCLFDGHTHVSLRDALRAGLHADELDRLLAAVLRAKHFKLGGHEDPAAIAEDAANNRPMTLIGG